jgi:CDP-diacylglycerol pyrophosphatase
MAPPIWKRAAVATLTFALLFLITALCTSRRTRMWIAAVAGVSGPAPHQRDRLWNEVRDCIAQTRSGQKLQLPCQLVVSPKELDDGYVVVRAEDLRDEPQPYHFLTVPTRRISGIESADKTRLNYWKAAWQQLQFTLNRRHEFEPDQMGLAINSEKGRSQDQLHIHMACIDRTVAESLREHASEIRTDKWSERKFELKNGHRYRVIREDRLETNPFELLKTIPPLPHDQRFDAKQTIVVTASGDGGFYILDNSDESANSDPTETGHGEDLLDPSCKTQSHIGAPL